jgi:hypothetical protein
MAREGQLVKCAALTSRVGLARLVPESEKEVAMKVFRSILPLAVVVLASCGPKPPPEPTEPQGPTAEELAQQRQLAEAPYQEAIQKFNTAIWELRPELLHEALTKSSYELFMQRTAKEAALRGIDDEITDEYFLEQQRDYKIVYSIKSIDLETQHAVVVGTIEGEVQWESEINFVEEDGVLKIDHSEVLGKAVADLDEAIGEKEDREAEIRGKVEALVADFNTALADKNAEMFEATLSDETAEAAVKYLGLLPKKEGGVKKPTVEKYMKRMAEKVASVEIKEINFDEPSVVLTHYPPVPKKLKKGEEPPAPFDKEVKLHEEDGRYTIDLSDFLDSKIKEMEAASAKEE